MNKIIFKTSALSMILLMGVYYVAHGGNPDRSGEAGAYELLINPWARSAGVFGMNSSRVEGVDAMRINVAGLAFTRKTEVVFSRTHWLQGTEIFLNGFGLAQKFGKDKTNVIGASIMAFDFEREAVTTFENHENEDIIGTFKPQFFNIGVAYSKAFSNRIYAGALVRIVSEKIADIGSFGFAIDLGIQYVTGAKENLRFGIALRNVGTPMKFSGDGLSFRGTEPNGNYQLTVSQRAQKFELPSLLNIGASYDLYADNLKNDEEKPFNYRITVMFNFTANSFGKDHVGGGLEFSWREILMLRGGYRWEKNITDATERTSAHTGFSAGFTAQVPIKKDGPAFALDYAYRTTSPFKGTHTYGIRLNL